ncbi:MFS transporter [Amycolatopsis ultiminotia]|uniref:MFS transporter n=1 Tax=Amycolatopsis ultiminotia TaxID=543629 RepID=UPI0031E5CCAA
MHGKRAFALVFVLTLTVVATQLNATMISPVLPAIAAEFHVGIDQAAQVSSLLHLIGSVSGAVFSRWSDFFGRRKTLVFVTAVTATGSVLCLPAPALPVLLVGRALNGFGGAAFAISYVLLNRSLTHHTFGITLGVLTAAPRASRRGSAGLRGFRRRRTQGPHSPDPVVRTAGGATTFTVIVFAQNMAVGYGMTASTAALMYALPPALTGTAAAAASGLRMETPPASHDSPHHRGFADHDAAAAEPLGRVRGGRGSGRRLRGSLPDHRERPCRGAITIEGTRIALQIEQSRARRRIRSVTRGGGTGDSARPAGRGRHEQRNKTSFYDILFTDGAGVIRFRTAHPPGSCPTCGPGGSTTAIPTRPGDRAAGAGTAERADVTQPEPSDVSDVDEEIAAALRGRRASSGLSLTQLAELSGVSAAHLSRIEKAQRAPSVRILLALARAYRVPIGTLIDEAEIGTVLVSRAGDRASHPGSRRRVTVLSRSTPDARLQATELTFPAHERSPGVVSHDGDEWIYVTRGALTITIEGTQHELGEGDSVHFSAVHPHEMANPHHTEASIVLVSTTEIAWHR